MKRIGLWFAFACVLGAAGCNKPSEDACRAAITNMRSLLGTDSSSPLDNIDGDIRRCKGGSKRNAVECASRAKTVDELRACDFMKVPARAGGAGSGSATGSGSGSAGSGR